MTRRQGRHDREAPLAVEFGVDFRYRVFFTEHAFDDTNEVLRRLLREFGNGPHRCLVTVDSGLAARWPELIKDVENYARSTGGLMELAGPVMLLPGGEDGKNSFEVPLKVIRSARQVHLCRHSFIIAVGGGAMLDAVGFAAALIHRGVRLIRVPTTVLSQNDSGIGVKNGVNLRGAKNFLGTFAPPVGVVNDAAFLETLDRRDRVAGLAEAFKVGCIKDTEFLDWLIENARGLGQGNRDLIEYSVRRCAELHAEHIAANGDPFEFGTARPLDFGHWCAHKLESLTLHELRHGEAVAVGIAVDLLYAARLGFITRKDARRVIHAMGAAGLPLWSDALEHTGPAGERLVCHGVEEFREHLGGALCVTLPCPIGALTEVDSLDHKLLESALRELQQIAEACSSRAITQ